MIPPQLEEYFAERMNVKTTVLGDASHAGLISQVAKVADVILEAASS
jgi:hypothetical protein